MEFDNIGQEETQYANDSCNTFESEDIASRNEKLDSGLETDILKIYVYQPYVRIRSIKLDSNFKISILNCIYPSNAKYLFNGQILDSEKTFKHYNICNGNKIVLISENMIETNPNSVQKWLKLTSDKEFFEERINLNINNDYRKEIARIKDIKYFKIENKRKKFGRYLKSQFSNQSKFTFWAYENKENKAGTKMNSNYEPLDSPSCEPFPITW